MTADLLSFSRVVRLGRGAQAEADRRIRLRHVRRRAFNRALHGEYCEADEATFGTPYGLMADGADWKGEDYTAHYLRPNYIPSPDRQTALG